MRLALTSILLLLFAAGCETIEGAGQDIQKAGEAVSDTANDAEDSL